MADEDSSQLNCEEEEMGAVEHSSCFLLFQGGLLALTSLTKMFYRFLSS